MIDLNVTSDEINALKYFYNEEYAAINQMLISDCEVDIALLSSEVENRVVAIDYSREGVAEYLKNIKLLYSLILKHYYKNPPKKRKTLYRGTNLSEVERFKNEVYIDRFLTATENEDNAINKYSAEWNRPAEIGITLTENVPYIYIYDFIKNRKNKDEVLISPFTKLKTISEENEKILDKNSKALRVYNATIQKQELDELKEHEIKGLYRYILDNAYLIKPKLQECIASEKENSVNFENIRKLEQLVLKYETEIEERESSSDYSDEERISDYENVLRINRQLRELKAVSTELFETRKQSINFINMWKKNIAVYLIAECKKIENKLFNETEEKYESDNKVQMSNVGKSSKDIKASLAAELGLWKNKLVKESEKESNLISKKEDIVSNIENNSYKKELTKDDEEIDKNDKLEEMNENEIMKKKSKKANKYSSKEVSGLREKKDSDNDEFQNNIVELEDEKKLRKGNKKIIELVANQNVELKQEENEKDKNEIINNSVAVGQDTKIIEVIDDFDFDEDDSDFEGSSLSSLDKELLDVKLDPKDIEEIKRKVAEVLANKVIENRNNLEKNDKVKESNLKTSKVQNENLLAKQDNEYSEVIDSSNDKYKAENNSFVDKSLNNSDEKKSVSNINRHIITNEQDNDLENATALRVKLECKENSDTAEQILTDVNTLLARQQNHARIAERMGASYKALNNAFEMRKYADELLGLVEDIEKRVKKISEEEEYGFELELEKISKINIEISTLMNYLNNPQIAIRNTKATRFDEMTIIEENELKRGIADRIRNIRSEAELKKLRDDLEIIEDKSVISKFFGFFTGQNRLDEFLIDQIYVRQDAIRRTLSRKLSLANNYSIHNLIAEIEMFIEENEDDELVQNDVRDLRNIMEELRKNYIIKESKVKDIIDEREGSNLPVNSKKVSKMDLIENETYKFLKKYGYDIERYTQKVEPEYRDTFASEISRIIEYINSSNVLKDE